MVNRMGSYFHMLPKRRSTSGHRRRYTLPATPVFTPPHKIFRTSKIVGSRLLSDVWNAAMKFTFSRPPLGDSDKPTDLDCRPGCSQAALLAECKGEQNSKQKNGCQAYHSGWSAGDFSCWGCGTNSTAPGVAQVSRDYAPCDLQECHKLCSELYASSSKHIGRCNAGCTKYQALYKRTECGPSTAFNR